MSKGGVEIYDATPPNYATQLMATVVCDLDACSGSHDMVVCRLFGGFCWFWLADCMFMVW